MTVQPKKLPIKYKLNDEEFNKNFRMFSTMINEAGKWFRSIESQMKFEKKFIFKQALDKLTAYEKLMSKEIGEEANEIQEMEGASFSNLVLIIRDLNEEQSKEFGNLINDFIEKHNINVPNI